MSLANKHKQWVLDTVDRLRQRKARPDLLRISRMVERFHGLNYTETQESLDKLCDEGVVLKVHFKGNVSYRHVRKPEKTASLRNLRNEIYCTSSRIMLAIEAVMKQMECSSVSLEELEKWLISKNPETRLVKHRLKNAIQRELDKNTITKTQENRYQLANKSKQTDTKQTKGSVNSTKSKEKVAETAASSSVKTTDKGGSSSSMVSKTSTCDNAAGKDSPRRGRPLSKRKKFKKTHGPDFESPLESRRRDRQESNEEEDEELEQLVCDFCSLSAESNPEGREEPLLICKECNAKAHPSCMAYSPELAERALSSPWQCMDCKMCSVCDGLEHADLMLFCDACDKGYHMNCLQPPLSNKPKGKWVCFRCKDEMKSNNYKDTTGEQKFSTDGSEKDEDESASRKRGRKRRLSPPTSPQSVKSARSERGSVETSSYKYVCNEPYTSDTSGAPHGTACLLTPSASPRPSDTFDYEVKMSLSGQNFPLTEDNTVYSDATEWTIEEVTEFFTDCGFRNEAQAFIDQEIDGPSLLLMRREDVISGLGFKLGPALKIYKRIAKLQQYSQSALQS